MSQLIQVVAGAQYGSEGKGHVTAQLVQKALRGQGMVINVRVAGPNAGHTVYDTAGNKFALRQVPVGAAISDKVICYIAPGSEVDPLVLFDEVALLREKGHNPVIHISGEATILSRTHKVREGVAELVDKIGSTGKGIGAARADRLMRGAERVRDNPSLMAELGFVGVTVVEPESLYSHDDWNTIGGDQTIIVEGTQGYGLGLHAGHYPQVTSSDCRAVDFLGMAGLSPWRAGTDIEVWLVARVYPIRVAGNSGDMKGETSWEDLGLPEERTTVTQKVRRVGQWDGDLVRRAVQDNGGSVVKVALTMVDQKFPQVARYNSVDRFVSMTSISESVAVSSWSDLIEDEIGAKVWMWTTSPVDAILFDRRSTSEEGVI